MSSVEEMRLPELKVAVEQSDMTTTAKQLVLKILESYEEKRKIITKRIK